MEAIENLGNAGGFWIALAKIDKRLGSSEKTESRLDELLKPYPSESEMDKWNKYYSLFSYYRELADRDKALSAITQALKHIHEIKPADTQFWSVALYAYHQRDYDCALRICDSWEQSLTKPSNTTRKSSLPAIGMWTIIRAACYLAKGDMEKARGSAELIDGYFTALPWYYCSQDELKELLAAIKTGNADFVFKRRSSERKEELFFDPQ